MKHTLKKYGILLFFVNLIIWATMASYPVTELLQTPVLLSRIFSLLLYLPFAAVILWKLIQDLQNFRRNWINYLYYLFAAYYCVLTAYRFFGGMDAKESLYYAVVLFGSLALYCQIRDGRLSMNADLYHTNFNSILLFMIVYKMIATVLATGALGFPRLLANPPVNNLYSTSMLVLLLPFIVDCLRKQAGRKLTVEMVFLYLSLILIFTCTSRAIFLLALLVLAGVIIIRISNRAVFKRAVLVVACAALTVGLLAAMDVGNVRYALHRELGVFESVNGDASDPTASNPNEMDDALEQIERSDSMRSELLALGIEQVKINPLFGTGDLYYTYDLGYKTMEQTAHNFVIESLVSFGIIGTLIVAAMLILILLDCGLLCKRFMYMWQQRISCLTCVCYYFALGFVQPSVYNTLLCPLFLLVMEHYGMQLRHPDSGDAVGS